MVGREVATPETSRRHQGSNLETDDDRSQEGSVSDTGSGLKYRRNSSTDGSGGTGGQAFERHSLSANSSP